MPYDNLIKRLWECASGECYKALVEKPLMVLSEKAGLNIPLPQPPKEETP